jgi:hypothetical protein
VSLERAQSPYDLSGDGFVVAIWCIYVLNFDRLITAADCILFVSLLFALSSGVYQWRCAVIMVCLSTGPVSEAAEADF